MTVCRSVRLYGYLRGESSFAQVTRGVTSALQELDEFAGQYPVDMEPELAPLEHRGGESAPLSLNCGAPDGLMMAHRYGSHGQHWLLLAPNSEGLPHGFVVGLRKPSDVLPRGLLTGGLLTPSHWAAKVLREAFPGVPVIVAPHGVSPDCHAVSPAARAATRKDHKHGLFNVLHMTSTEAERKSTKPLLQAWRDLKRRGAIPKISRLHILMNPTHVSKVRWWASDIGLADTDYVVSPGLVHGRGAIASLYGAMHLVCQPSRAEGFGIVPLEALACGTPVAITTCTGHSEYAATGLPGMVEVESGLSGPMDDFPGARAPIVRASAIADALEFAYGRWESLADQAEQNAAALAGEWSWTKKNVPALRAMIAAASSAPKG